MKEFLTKNNQDNYELVYHKWRDDDIEIPERADLYVYWPESDTCNFQADKSFFENGSWNLCAWHVDEIKSGEAGAEVLWQRQPENQNPLDDVKWFEGDLKVSNGYTIGEDCNNDKKHSHYFKNVKHLDYVDVYRVLDLFEVVDPCIQHAIKKLLCAGMRGAKNQPQDVQEAIDSLVRYQEMCKEDRK